MTEYPKENIINYESVPSTNEKAKELALKDGKPWTIVLSSGQDSGHGRKGEEWFSPKGGLYFTVILPKSDIHDLQTLTILAAFVVAGTIKEEFGLEPMIKLPNDVFVNGKKVCGILTENVIGNDVKMSVMGIGLNTNIEGFPEGLKNIATSIKMELGKEVDNNEILKQIVSGLKEQLKTISK